MLQMGHQSSRLKTINHYTHTRRNCSAIVYRKLPHALINHSSNILSTAESALPLLLLL